LWPGPAFGLHTVHPTDGKLFRVIAGPLTLTEKLENS
jgi:hypothetical protein